MNTIYSKCADAAIVPPDPRKHVNFVQGMVLGAPDLIQDFVYQRYQREWLARDAIGYGTLCGLHVAIKTRDPVKGPEVTVTPGAALSPRGRLIRVIPQQCAVINNWLRLDKTKSDLQTLGLSVNGPLTIYVVLCFRDCLVDPLPIPGEPCRCENQTMAPSRVLDDFRLEMRLQPPRQREEDAIPDFVQWLRQIKVSGASNASSLDQFLDAIRQAARDSASPLDSPPDFLYGSPPQNLTIPAGQLCEYLRAALRLWVTELRPLWQAQWAEHVGGGCGCHGDDHTQGEDAEECLLLDTVTLQLVNGQISSDSDAAVDDSRRPFVVHLRMLQEMLLCGPCCGKGCNNRTFADVFALDDHRLCVWIHYPEPVTFDVDAVQLEIDGATVPVIAVNAAGSELNVFNLDLGASPLTPLAHLQRITLKLDLRKVTETLSPGGTLADAIQQSGWCYPNVEDAIATVFGVIESAQAVQLPALNGDVTGSIGNNTVERIQNINVNLTGLTDGAVLGFNSTPNEWQPVPPLSQPALPAALAFGGNGDAGTAREYARADHVHPLPNLPAPFQVTSGLINFLGVVPGLFARISPSIDHGHGKRAVMIRLGMEFVQSEQNIFAVENTDTFIPAAPLCVAVYVQNAGSFAVALRDTRPQGAGPKDWHIRWWAVPVTKDMGSVNVQPGQVKLAPEIVLPLIPIDGMSLNALAESLGVPPDQLKPIIDQLVEMKSVRLVRGKITPI